MPQTTKDHGVAPIISVILLVAITVGLAAAAGAVVLSMASMDGMPAVGILIEEKNGVVAITHFAGEKLATGTYFILADDVDRTKDFTGPGLSDGYFGPGDILSWKVSSGALRHVSVVYEGEKGTFLLAEKWFEGISGDGGLRAAFTMTSTTGTSRSNMPSALQASTADLTGGYPMTVLFTPEENSADAEYLWTFGNGNTSTAKDPSQEYASEGTYTVTLKVTNKTNGGWNSSSQTISVRKPGLTAMTWVKLVSDYDNSKLPKQSFYFRASANTQGSDPEWGFQVQNRDGFEYKLKSSSNGNYLLSDFSPQKNVWYHLAGLSDGAQGKLYINGSTNGVRTNAGKDIKTISVTRQVDLSTGNIFKSDGSPYEIAGSSEFSFPFTPAEISTIYNSQKGTYS